MSGPWPNFSRDEFACQHCGRNEIEDEYIDVLQVIRSQTGVRMMVTSGYRCPEHPIEAGKSQPGEHSEGSCSDIGVSHESAFRVLQAAMAHPSVTGIGVNQKGSARFIHIGTGPGKSGRPRPHLWSY